jgi:hypothetical protein
MPVLIWGPLQDIIMEATKGIEGCLAPKNKSCGSSWWRNAHFKPGVTLPCGCENFSPATFPQGHTVTFVAAAPGFEADLIALLEYTEVNNFTVVTHSRCTGVDGKDCTC